MNASSFKLQASAPEDRKRFPIGFRAAADSLDSALTPYTDWDRIWYGLSGSSDFNDGSHAGPDVEPFTFDDFTEQNALVVNDRSTPDCRADLNGDGIVDFGDIDVFLANFFGGC